MNELAEVFSLLRTEQELQSFLAAFLTPQEAKILLNRWKILQSLLMHRGYAQIKAELSVGNATIARATALLGREADANIIKAAFTRYEQKNAIRQQESTKP